MPLLLVGCIKVGMNTTLDATFLQCYYWQCPVSSSRLGLGVYGIHSAASILVFF